MTEIDSLADAFRQATGSVQFNAQYLRAAGATPPDGLDAELAKAFRLKGAGGLTLQFTSGKQVQVDGSVLTVSGVQLSFLGYDATKSQVTLVFERGSRTSVEVLIETALTGWSFASSFTAMTGPPFDRLPLAAPAFLFTTRPCRRTWQEKPLDLRAGQNFAALVKVPAQLKNLLRNFDIQWDPGTSYRLSGPVQLDKVTAVTGEQPGKNPVLYPVLDLAAPLPEQNLKILLVDASAPAIGLRTTDGSSKAAGEDRLPWLGLRLRLDLGGKRGAYDLLGSVSDSGVPTFHFELTAEGAPMTPGDAIALIRGPSGRSFLTEVPEPLQRLLSSVGLRQLVLLGMLGEAPSGKPSLTQAGVLLSTRGSGSVPLFPGLDAGENLAVDGFDLYWTVTTPLKPATSASSVTLTAYVTLWPQVFTRQFVLSIGSDLSVDARYAGTVSFGTLLQELTSGTVRLPKGVALDMSDVRLGLYPAERRYAFGFVVDADVAFLHEGGKPLLTVRDMEVSLTALRPAKGATGGRTAYVVGVSGGLAIGPVNALVDIGYDSTVTPAVWQLNAALDRPLALDHLVGQFFPEYRLPDFLAGLQIDQLGVGAVIPPGSGRSTYSVAAAMSWSIPHIGTARAQVGLDYDAAREAGSRFAGQIVGDLYLKEIGAEVAAGYRFGPASADPGGSGTGSSTVVWVQWEGIRGAYDLTDGTLTLNLTGWSVGRLLQSLVRTVNNPYFTLDQPWDFLNSIPLDGLGLTIRIKAQPGKPRFEATYTLSRPISVGVVTVKGLTFRRGEGSDAKVTLAIDGSTTIGGLEGSPLLDPSKGQDVTRMPATTAQGASYFDLWLLMIGQRVAVNAATMTTTKDIVDALEGTPEHPTGIPDSGQGQLPVDPKSTAPLQPRYDPSSNWLVAAHFGLLQAAGQWTVDCRLVFNDPHLYGLRLELNGEKAKVLAGLALDVLYKKVTDDVGVYQAEFTFPAALRTFDLGAFSVTLPAIGVRIYTNGDFLIDLGFPYRVDFSRSFTLQAVIGGIPVIGSAGLYFGKLSIGSEAHLPVPRYGAFGPAFVFGVGLQAGVGHTIDKGIFKAGFSVTVFGIVEGVIAGWHPPAVKSGETGALPAPSAGGALQSDYYFRVEGTFGLLGRLYGSVDFAVVKATCDLTVRLDAKIVYQSFADIQLSASASVNVRLSVRISLGLFSISLSFSFSTTVTADLTIKTAAGVPPWERPQAVTAADARTVSLTMAAPVTGPVWKRVKRSGDNPALKLHPAAQFTVAGPAGGKPAQGAFVWFLVTDVPSSQSRGRTTSFEALCHTLLAWVVDAYTNGTGTEMDPDAMTGTRVTDTLLRSVAAQLADPADTPLTRERLENLLLEPGFAADLSPAPTDGDGNTALKAGSTLFPAFPGLTATFPDPGQVLGSGRTKTVTPATYVTLNGAYRTALARHFRQLAALVEQEYAGKEPAGDSTGNAGTAEDPDESFAQFVFQDWFTLVARQLLQAADDAFTDCRYPLSDGHRSPSAACTWANERGNALTPASVAAAAADHPLEPGRTVTVNGLAGTVQRDETVTAVAKRYSDRTGSPRWTVGPASLIEASKDVHGLVAPGQRVTVGAAGPVITEPGDSFTRVADRLGITVAQLAADAGTQAQHGLLTPGTALTLPGIGYTTAQGDTLRGIARSLGTTAVVVAEAGTDVLAFAGDSLPLPRLTTLAFGDVWQALTGKGRLRDIAGMAARFHLHGMRLPAKEQPGLKPSADFLYPTGQDEYGLYQLAGQQVPTPALPADPTFRITLNRGTVSWLRCNGSPSGASVTLTLDKAARELSTVLTWLSSHTFDPQARLSALPGTLTAGRRYPARAATPWTTSGLDEVAKVVTPPGGTPPTGPGLRPALWDLPDALLHHIEDRATALAGRFTPRQAQPYLPEFVPELVTHPHGAPEPLLTPVSHYTYATRVSFRVRRLAQHDDQAPRKPHASDVTPPDAATSVPPPLAPFTYEILGPSPADAVLLERLLTALDGGGEELITGQFLLHPALAHGTRGLAGTASASLLAFLTRTNLSTESAPPAFASAVPAEAKATPQPPRGIANPPGEVVRLLWEQSTVRKGGYYLHYHVPGEDRGLPDALFDASGTADLTLVITYDRTKGQPGAGSLPHYVNALVTADPVTPGSATLTFAAQPAPKDLMSAPVEGNTTLAALAALYGCDPGTTARRNADRPLTAGREIGIGGAWHQVTPAEAGTPDVWQAVADRWSRGAKHPVTVQALKQANPGTAEPPPAGTVLRVPRFVHVTGSGREHGAGATFASLRQYYGLSYDALGDAAREVSGLFPAGTALRVDTEERAVRPALGRGNAGIEVTRAAAPTPPELPESPTEAQRAAFAEATLRQLYSLLSSGITETPGFRAGPQGLPFGPQHDSATTGPSPADRLRYTFTAGLTAFAKVNPAPAPGDPQLPARSANPYAGVGTLTQFGTRWLDIFGNTLAAGTHVRPVDEIPLPVQYTDALIGLSQWPHVHTAYTYRAGANGPELSVSLELQTEAYAGGREAAVKDLRAFRLLYFQLVQNYDGAAVPEVSGYAVGFRVLSSLLKDPGTALSTAQADTVRKFVADCLVHVSHRAAGTSATGRPSVTLSFPVPPDALREDEIIPLKVGFELTRQSALADPALRVSGALTDHTEIAPHVARHSDLRIFAEDFEKAFTTATSVLRLGTSSATPGKDSERDRTLWAVRLARPGSPEAGLGCDLPSGSAAAFFAPKPLATALCDLTAEVSRYETGKGLRPGQKKTLTLRGADPNVWARQALAAVDALLAPTFTSPAFVLDRLAGIDHPERDGLLGRILGHKKKLAGAIAASVLPVSPGAPFDTSGAARTAAGEKLHEALLDHLAAAYSVTCVAVLKADHARAHGLPPGVAAPPRFYGQPMAAPPHGEEASTDTAKSYALSSAKVPLRGPGEHTSTSYLAFLFESKSLTEHASVPLDVTYEITHLEHDIRDVPGIDGYRDARWITFVSGAVTKALGTVTFPVVLRALPQPPSITAQSGRPAAKPGTPDKLPLWTYALGYSYRSAAQDWLDATVRFGGSTAAQEAEAPEDVDTPLRAALADFVTSHPAIAADLDRHLRPVGARSKPNDTDVLTARAALQAFETLLGAVATAYERWASPPATPPAQPSAAAPEDTSETVQVWLRLAEETDGRARMDLRCAAGVTPPAVLLGAEYEPVATDPPQGVQRSWHYRRRGTPGTYLRYAAAPAECALEFGPRDIFRDQEASGQLHVERNADVVEPEFRFSTPEVRAAAPVVPLLFHAAYRFGTQGRPARLQDHLDGFFKALFTGADGRRLTAKMTAAYAYAVAPAPGLPLTILPIALLPLTSIDASPTADATWSRKLTDAVEEFVRTQKPRRDGTSRIILGLDLFGAGQQMPLLTIRDLWIPTTELTFPA
ncbi:LysM peptidoglycan-binding domain-containing protein [Streptomyces chattanoogensis]|uniref:LysM domain-containing protein n=1 Tax=Streptomyces chattanoogensis TaxID=66876 RepID=A0A0N0GWL1_9ACTN|nr:LysM peptidoglycan-binding domain-containing protein [Streptomyces chattanoogensis]KPC60172.1 hypothetical protein ADL29_30960 [Streptomyces chattanoogensis]